MFPLNTALKLKDNASIGTFFGLDESGSLQILTSEQNIQTVYSADSIEISKNNKNLICIDFGNTRIHMTAINEFHEVSELHFHYDTFSTIKNKFKKFIRLFQSDFITKIRTVYISVNSARKTSLALKGIQGLLQMYLPDKNIKSQKVTEKEIFKNFPILNTFDQKTLGADRSLKCIFSYTKSQEINKNVLVVSFGTATTCEGFTPEGKMIENFVYPGVQMSFDALHHFTALLPRIDAKKSKFIENPNYWTQELYLNRGITIILVASILLVAKLHGPCRIFLTGGDSHLIKQILLALVPKELLDNLDIEITENIETKILAEYYEKFK